VDTFVLLVVVSLLPVCVWTPVPAVRAQDEADAGGGPPVCPLSKDQTQKAIDAFKALAPVFRVDRCINCHGDVDPFTEGDGGHEGGQIPQIRNDDGSVDFGKNLCTMLAPGVTRNFRVEARPRTHVICEQDGYRSVQANALSIRPRPGLQKFHGAHEV